MTAPVLDTNGRAEPGINIPVHEPDRAVAVDDRLERDRIHAEQWVDVLPFDDDATVQRIVPGEDALGVGCAG